MKKLMSRLRFGLITSIPWSSHGMTECGEVPFAGERIRRRRGVVVNNSVSIAKTFILSFFHFFIFSLIFHSSIANDVLSEERGLVDKYIPMKNATVQIMNKQAGKVQTLIVPINKKVKFDKLEIIVRKCLSTNEFLPEDFFIFVEINKEDNQIFSGWMTKSEPGQNPLQDPDNDLWLVSCDTEIKTDDMI